MPSLVTLTTDFGTDSPYVAQMKGALWSVNREVQIVDVTHAIPPQNIRAAALVLDEVCFRFPRGTLHIAVVDPGVGTEREIVLLRLGGQLFLGPNNGLFGLVAQRFAPQEIIALTKPEFWSDEVSNTFHGRDIMAPVAAKILAGLAPQCLGESRATVVACDLPVVRSNPRSVAGEVIAVDLFGNLLTNIRPDDLPADVDRSAMTTRVGRDERPIRGICRTYGDCPPGTCAVLFGSNNRLEVAVANGRAAEVLQAGPGTAVTVSW